MARSEYNPTNWHTSKPITQEAMNKIEQELLLLSQQNQSDEADLGSIEDLARSAKSKAETLENKIGTNFIAGRTITERLVDLESSGQSSQDEDEWISAQVHGAVDNIQGRQESYDSLDERLYNIETQAKTEKGLRTANTTSINNAMRNASDSLVKRFQDAERDISSLSGAMNSLGERLDGASTGHGSLAARLSAIDNNTTPTRTLPDVIQELANAHGQNNEHGTLSTRFGTIETELSNAHESTALGKTVANGNAYASLDARFEAIEEELTGTNSINSRIDTLTGDVSGLANSKLDKTAIANNLTTDTTGKALDAYQGYILNQDKVNYTDIKDNLTSSDTDKPLSAKQGKALKDMIGDGFSSSNTIAARIDAIDNGSTGTVATLAGKVSALEAEVDMTSANSRIDNVETEVTNARTSSIITDEHTEEVGGETVTTQVPHTYASVDARLEAIEAHAAAVRTDVNTIADELSMRDQQVISGVNTRVDRLNDNVLALGKEIGMLSEDATLLPLADAIDREGTRIDTIATEIGNAHRANINNDTLDNRFDAIENDISHPAVEADPEHDIAADAGGLTERLTAVEDSITGNGGIEERLDAIDDASTGTIKALQDVDEALDGRLNAIDGGTALDTTNGTLATRVGSLETTVNTANTGLVAKVSTIESDLNTAQTGLKAKVAALEGKDTIIINYDGENSNYTNEVPNLNSPSADADYLIADDDGKYFYWRYINNNWKLISGAGGGGTGSSSGLFIESLSVFEGQDPLIPDPNIDYFVGTNLIGYTHYRYIAPVDENSEGYFVRILPKGLLKDAGVTNTGGLVGHTVEDDSTNVFAGFLAFKAVEAEPVLENEKVVATNLIFTDTDGQTHTARVTGGGGGGSAYTVKLNNEMGSLVLTVPDIEGQTTNLQARAVVKEGTDIAENLGTALTVTTQYSSSKNGPWSVLDTRTVENNVSFQVNITNILRTGIKSYIRMTLTTNIENENITRTINYEVTKVEMSISAINFNPAIVRTGNLVFQYKCIGSELEKEVHFKLDGVDAVTPVVTKSHNEPLQQSITLTGKDPGMHSFQVYFTVNGVSSNILNYYILYNNNTVNTLPMIALAAEKPTITYGDELIIDYTTAVNSNIENMDNVLLEMYTLEGNTEVPVTHAEFADVRNERVHQWTPIEYPTSGIVYIRGTASRTIDGQVYTNVKTITVTVNELVTDYTLEYAGQDNLLYLYNAYGRTNHDVGKEHFTYDYVSHDTGNPVITWNGSFNNFNWSTDGYADGESLTIGGGATHTIDVPIFDTKNSDNISLEVAPESYNDPTQNGRTIEIEYEVQSATDLNDTIIDCMDNNHVGFRITPQSCYLLNNNVNISFAQDGTGTILNEDAIAAAYLTTGVRTHLAFVIEPWAETKAYDKKYHQSVNIYINGEFANACPYNRDNSTGNISDSFKTNATIRIGSASCIIKLYSIKMYNRGLTNTEILQNYKMAPGRTMDKIARFDKNNVLSGTKVSYELARKKFNCLLLVGPEPVIQKNEQGQDYNAMPTISPYKGAPSPIGRKKDGEVVGKTESGLILTYPDDSIDGYKTEFSLLDKMAVTGDEGYVSSNNVQGTSSQKYPIHNLKVYLMKGVAGKEVYSEEDILTREVNSASIIAAATTAYQSVYGTEGELPEYITTCATEIAKLVANSEPMLTRAEVTQAVIDYLTNEDANVGAAYISTEDELVVEHEVIGYSKSEKVKYKLPGSKGKGESTLCWKADYMSTDHANTYNANIADSLFSDSLNPSITNEDWQANVQNTVHGIRCLLFKQEGSNPPEFVADGCLNNDKGNSKTYGLEYTGDDGANTTAQKWEFTNNSDDLGFFKYDCVFYPTGNDQHYRALDAFESCFPDQGDLEDAQDAYKAEHDNQEDPNLNPNYNHLQVLLTWVSQRANFWDADPTPTGTVTHDEEHDTYTTTGTVYTYNGIPYSNMRDYKKAIFRAEFTKHFNLDHVLVYYLFSEYTALCDNRVKNMFMRSDTIRSERIKLLNSDTIVFEGNSNPNADYWKSYIDIQTNEVNQQGIINTIAAVYSEINELEEVTIPDYAEDLVAQVAADAAASTLTLAQLQALIVSYLNEEDAAVGAAYMVASEGNEYVVEHRMSHADDIDWEEGEGHSQFARWAPVLYDLDSCFGVENVGLLKIPYNADWQYFSEGQYRFNGHDSVFWLMVEEVFATELAAKALTLYNRSRGLNYNTFYQEQVVDNNEETAPAMTNQDMLLKFDAPWATGFMNYANTPPTYETPEYKYLQRGTRAAQKTSFLFKRSMLLSSKYQASAFLNDKISFRYGADLTANQAIIECSANQIMYPAVSFGDNKGWTQALELTNGTPVVGGLVNAGETCRIRATSSAKGQDTLFIAGASVLTDIGDLSVFKPYELKVGQGKNLKKLIIGSNATGYTNAVTSTIENLSACSILEEINIRNCTAFTSLDVSANGLIKRVYAGGSGAGTISLPSGGVLETIEYGAATSNITILNHGTLQNFSYEIEDGEQEPQYSNLNKLWIENTPNVPIVDIVNKRLGSLTNGLRLVGIDVDLGNDATFLQTITSVLADGKYLDSTGSSNDQLPPYISGRVHINEIRASLLAKVKEMYPFLIVYNTIDGSGDVSNNIIDEYTVEYRNYDNTLLYTDNRTNTEHFIDPVFDENPITGQPYIEMPTKPQDAQYTYSFGTYNSRTGKYNRYSGWVKRGTNTNPNSSETVGGNTVFIAVYPTTVTRQYWVKWYDKYNGTAKQEIQVEYGDDLSAELSPIEQGTLLRTDRSGNQVKVFTGWSRPLGKITEDTNVYAMWQTSGIDEDTENIDMSTLNAADLYALSLVGNQKKTELLSEQLGVPIFINMGQDFDYQEGVSVTNLLGNESEFTFGGTTDDIHIYNGTGGHSEIRPLAINSDWTLAIDYKFLMDNVSSFNGGREFVLASCYTQVGSTINGFKLSLVRLDDSAEHYIQVSWGTETQIIDYAITDESGNRYFTSYRNVVVLSHNADRPNLLRVSYVLPNTSNSYAPSGANCGTFVTNTELTYSTSTITAPLILGGNYSGDSTTIEEDRNSTRPAQGIIYWAKYWNTDLGEQNCSKLASWPHERVAFYLTGFNGNVITTNNGTTTTRTEQIYDNSELSFVAAQGMGDRYLYATSAAPSSFISGVYGWELSDARNICNRVIYEGMPEAYKSIIRYSSIDSSSRNVENTPGSTSNVRTQDYLFFPAYREVVSGATAGSTYGGEVRSQWTSPWSWMIPSELQILETVQGQNAQLEYKSASNINIYRYRFLGAYIREDAQIFNISEDPTSRTFRIQRPGQTSETAIIHSGDILIKNGEAYMYFTKDEIDTGITVDEIVNTNTYKGGWKRCDMWNLRTYHNNAMSTNENLFLRILTTGALDDAPSKNSYREYGRLLCPEFTI